MAARPKVGLKGSIAVLLMLVLVLYPLLVYLHIDAVDPHWFGTVLLVGAVLRFFLRGSQIRISDWLMLAIAVGFCALVIFLDSPLLLKFYPVLMNVGMGLMFIVSLWGPECLIATFAKAGGKAPPPQAQDYVRTLTLIWGIVLLLNGVIAAYTAWFTSTATWALYNGVIAYLILGVFVALEWGYRGYYKKRHNIVDDESEY